MNNTKLIKTLSLSVALSIFLWVYDVLNFQIIKPHEIEENIYGVLWIVSWVVSIVVCFFIIKRYRSKLGNPLNKPSKRLFWSAVIIFLVYFGILVNFIHSIRYWE
jgi:hypothetical protein